MRVCLVSSEVAPFAKTGGLADVAAALPRFLAGAGHDVRVVMPYYERIRASEVPAAPVERLADLPLEFGEREVRVSVYTTPLPDSDATVWFIACPELYGREELYGHDDDYLRFAALSRGALALCQWTQWAPHVIHCNDWHTALVPLDLKTFFHWDELFNETRSLLTIHNIGYQGTFPARVVTELGLTEVKKYLNRQDLAAGHVNFLKTGVRWADALTTVSETYAREIRTAEFGVGLEELLEARRGVLHGIVNGVDYGEWDPAADELLPHRYGPDDLAGKARNKAALLEHFELAAAEEAPVFGIVSRLTHQKGFELLPDILPVLLHTEDMRLVVLGSGEESHERYFEWLAGAFPEKVGFHCGYSNELAHLIEAGADAFLMPSRYEPCGLNQMYSLKYGTVPIVRKTGGLADTVEPWNPEARTGTGFLFEDFAPEALLGAIRDALHTWRDRAAWSALVANGMALDWSWEAQGPRYVALYEQLSKS